jgi:hypothetical protein
VPDELRGSRSVDRFKDLNANTCRVGETEANERHVSQVIAIWGDGGKKPAIAGERSPAIADADVGEERGATARFAAEPRWA